MRKNKNAITEERKKRKKGREKMQKEFSMDIVLKHYEEVIGS